MAATMDTPMPQHDDLNLMGMQELDSTLSIFESSNPGRESSTPDTSNYAFEDSINITEPPSHTIIVESPIENYTRMNHSEVRHRARFNDTRSVFSSTNHYSFVLSTPRLILEQKLQY
jgi:hypothetical protein